MKFQQKIQPLSEERSCCLRNISYKVSTWSVILCLILFCLTAVGLKTAIRNVLCHSTENYRSVCQDICWLAQRQWEVGIGKSCWCRQYEERWIKWRIDECVCFVRNVGDGCFLFSDKGKSVFRCNLATARQWYVAYM